MTKFRERCPKYDRRLDGIFVEPPTKLQMTNVI